MKDFGTIGICTRIGNSPDPFFFNCWTRLLLMGIRKGDNVIVPEWRRLFAHFAANHMVRQFLKTDLDTLLFIDDDMEFGPGFLEEMRSREENWKYDIVQGFYTTRVSPARPLMYRLNPKQPKHAKHTGSYYDYFHDWKPGDVVPVDAVGLGFTLIRREVFETMVKNVDPEYFGWFVMPDSFSTEDMVFCRAAQKLGFTFAVDTNIQCGHVGRRTFSIDDYAEWREENKLDA